LSNLLRRKDRPLRSLCHAAPEGARSPMKPHWLDQKVSGNWRLAIDHKIERSSPSEN
jgi:hypothetical protein